MRASSFAPSHDLTIHSSHRAASRHLRRSRRCPTTPSARLPTRGYFAEADPQAEIYSRAPKKFDPAKKPGKWEPEFIWQTNWQEALQYEKDLKAQMEKRAIEDAAVKSGRLSLSRVSDLESLDTDLSSTLAPSQSTPSPQPPKYLSMDVFAAKPGTYPIPSKSDAKKWKRYARFEGGGAIALTPTLDQPDEASIAAAREQYDKLKGELQNWTLLVAGVGFAVCWEFYSADIAVSYAMGSAAGLFYLRQLGNSADGMGGSGLGAVSSMLSQPRLLIPAALVLVFNRWNLSLAEPTGVHLQLIPMLLGFFTYKAAVVGKQAFSIMLDMSTDIQGPYERVEGVGVSRRGVGREAASGAQQGSE